MDVEIPSDSSTRKKEQENQEEDQGLKEELDRMQSTSRLHGN